MRRHHPYHSLQAGFLSPEMSKLSWSQSLSNLGGGLVAIFIPIFLLKLHYSLAAVLGYMVFYGLFCFPTLYLAMRLVVLVGANRTMGVANICQAAFLGLLITLPTYHWSLISLAALAAWINSAYYPPFHANFAIARTPSQSGRQLSYIYALIAIAGAIAPAIGGILATAFNIKIVYGIAAGIFLVAPIPMLWGPELVKPADFKLKRLKQLRIKPDLMAYGGWAVIETTEMVVWPIIIFMLVSSYASIGLLSSVLIITGIFTTLYIGRREQQTSEKHYIKRGSQTVSLTNFVRVFASGSSAIFGMNLLSGVTFHVLEVPFFTRFYRHVGSGPTLEYLFAMEGVYGLFFSGFYGILLISTVVFSSQTVLVIGLLLTIPASYLATRMR